MISLFAWWFRLKGWKIGESFTNMPHRGIIIAAPHTSNWDFVYSLAALHILRVKTNYMAKKELFRWPLKYFLLKNGGIPVARRKNEKLVDTIVKMYEERDHLVLMISPEGTRKRVGKWKSGFYHIATRANVPIYPAYLDYKNKMAGVGEPVYLSGDKQKDAAILKSFYADKTAKFPANFSIDAIKFN